MDTQSVKSKVRFWKIGLNVLLLGFLIATLFQNNAPVSVDLLFWETEVSLSFLLLGTAVLGALITFFTVLIKGRG